MNKDKHIPSGYKPSPLGPIPEDWEVKRIGDFGKVVTGSTPPTEDADNYGSTYKFVSPADISDNKYIQETEKHLSEKGFAISRRMPKGTVLFTCIGSTIGKCAVANEELTSNQQINAVICDSNHNGDYLYYELCNRSGRIRQIAGEQAVPIINKSTFESFKIICPTLPEQNRIATLLSLWDTAIEKQTALIEKLTLRKRGLMQQLLTGKKRLKGFGGEWKEVRLGEMAMLVGGGTPTTKNTNYWNGNILWISSSDLKEDDLRISGTRFITEEAIVNSTTQLLPTKSILIVTRVGVGKVAIAEQPTCVSQDFTCLIKYDAETNFLAYYLLQLMKKKKNQSQGTSIKGISVDEISKIRIYLPTKIEQVAIASVLVNADKEIEIQKQKLAAIQTQKKGLMQVLLSGKRRVK